MVYFTCLSCGVSLGPFKQNNSTEVSPGSCPCCHQRGPFKVDEEQTLYGNYQKLAIQEAPGAVPPGRVPRHKGVVLLADLIDVARPGEEVEVTGVYVHSYETGISGRAGFPIFSTTIEANHVAKRTSAATRPSSRMNEEEKRHVLRFARDPNSDERIVRHNACALDRYANSLPRLPHLLLPSMAKSMSNVPWRWLCLAGARKMSMVNIESVATLM